jgi:hypothetical protein
VTRYNVSQPTLQEGPRLQSDARRPLIGNAMAALVLGLAIFILVYALGSWATGPQTQPWLLDLRWRIGTFPDHDPRLRALIILFAGIAAIRLILAGLLRPSRRWSLIAGGIVLVLSLARELPGLF